MMSLVRVNHLCDRLYLYNSTTEIQKANLSGTFVLRVSIIICGLHFQMCGAVIAILYLCLHLLSYVHYFFFFFIGFLSRKKKSGTTVHGEKTVLNNGLGRNKLNGNLHFIPRSKLVIITTGTGEFFCHVCFGQEDLTVT